MQGSCALVILAALIGQTASSWMSVYNYEAGSVVFQAPKVYQLSDLTVTIERDVGLDTHYVWTPCKSSLSLDCTSRQFIFYCFLVMEDLCSADYCFEQAHPLLVFYDPLTIKVSDGTLNLETAWKAWNIEVGGGWHIDPESAVAVPTYTEAGVTFTQFSDMTMPYRMCKVDVYLNGDNYALGFRATYCDQDNVEVPSTATMMGGDAGLGEGNPSATYSWTGEATSLEMYQDAPGYTCGIKINDGAVMGCAPGDAVFAFTVSNTFPLDGRGLLTIGGVVETGTNGVMLVASTYSLYPPTVTKWTPFPGSIETTVTVFWDGTSGTMRQKNDPGKDSQTSAETAAGVYTLILNDARENKATEKCTSVILDYDVDVKNRMVAQWSWYNAGDEHPGYQMYTSGTDRWQAGDPVQLGTRPKTADRNFTGPSWFTPVDHCVLTNGVFQYHVQLQPGFGVATNDFWIGKPNDNPLYDMQFWGPIEKVKIIQDDATNGEGFIYTTPEGMSYTLGSGRAPAGGTETEYDCSPGVLASFQVFQRDAQNDLFYVFCQNIGRALTPTMVILLPAFIINLLY